ncbi:Transforming growth factor beta receptor type 3 [Frankliniella fusca]|uniref:Transforming growth factor beta receptor type 3 n=1 Tax=Frankliniella fusca TaxID=407009 RepID=A0AAE1LDX7_9NEOP|nr:Transforming growth factor beta receptor type 3 [Frankliniella fusca]
MVDRPIAKISVVVASLSSELTLNKSTLDITKLTAEKSCNLEQGQGGPYLEPWREIPQPAQGCWVPYFGPQGHGHLPEEVHILHITNIVQVFETHPKSNQVTVTINLQLNNSLCQNGTDDQTYSGLTNSPFEFHKSNEEILAPKTNVPSLLQFSESPDSPFYKLLPYPSGQPNARSYVTSNLKTSIAQRPLVLLLTSDYPVTWQIKKSGCWNKEIINKVQAIVENESAVVSDFSVDVLSKTWVKRITRKSIQRYARRTFHGVASFTQVKGANTIKISVGPYGLPDDGVHQVSFRNRNKLNYCDFNSREDSKVVTASSIMPLSYEHCVVGDSNSTKTFIVEVQLSSTEGNGHMDYVKESGLGTSITNLPQTFVYLSNNVTPVKDKDKIDQQHFTIFLKSHKPTKWVVFISAQSTNLDIVTSYSDVIDYINNSGKLVKTLKRNFSKPGFDLLHEVLTELDSQVLYFRVQHVTGLALTLSGSTDKVKFNSSLESFHGFSPNPFNQDLSFDLPVDINGRNKLILTILESEMILVCGKSMLEVFLPAPSLVKLGVRGISLQDESCQSRTNGSHFIIKSLLKGCGSDVHITDDKASIISNKVIVNISSPEVKSEHINEFPSQAVNSKMAHLEVPISCGWNEDFVRSIFNSRDVSSEDEETDNSTPSSSSSSLYQLELYFKDPFTQKLSSLKTKKTFEFLERLYVRAWMEDAPSAQAVIESCWINNSPHPSQPQQKNVLLSGMCPLEKHVNLEHEAFALLPSKTKSSLFSFQVLKEFAIMGQELYVHCQIGVCLSDLKYSKAKPVVCMDPHDYCLHYNPLSTDGKLISTAHQVLTRGPILLSSVGHAYPPNFSSDTRCADVAVFPYSSSISVHMTLTIAVCSFIIGIGLTATLWLIHHKTEPKQRVYHAREHSLGSQTAVLGSSLSPNSGCSSTNSQSVITS